MKNKTRLLRVSHYDLSFDVLVRDGILRAAGKLRVQNDSGEQCERIPILLYHQLKGVCVKDSKGEKMNFSQEEVQFKEIEGFKVNHISVELPEDLAVGGSVELYFEYEGTLNGYAETGMLYVKDSIQEDFSVIRPDCLAYPIVAEPNFKSSRRGVMNRFHYDISVRVPKGYVAASGGKLKEVIKGDTEEIYKYTSQEKPWRFDIFIGKYRIFEDKEKKLKIFSFSEGDIEGVEKVKKETLRVYEFYSKLFGEYKRNSQYSILAVKNGYGQQNADDYITLQESVFDPDKASYGGIYHEIAHIWNVSIMDNNTQNTRFFDEAFAVYFQMLAELEFNGEERYLKGLKFYRNHFNKGCDDDIRNFETPISEYWKERISQNSYTKGAWVLYVLHNIIGDEKFIQTLREFLWEYKDKQADFKVFQEVAERISGRDLSKFFQEWIYGIESSNYLKEELDIEDIVLKYSV